MRVVKIFEIGEEVLIKVKVSAIIPDKDRFIYEVIEPGGTDKLKHRFQEKDLVPIVDDEVAEESVEAECDCEE